MNDNSNTGSKLEKGSSAAPAAFVETWATPGELAELDGLLNHFAELAERLTGSPVGSA